MEGRIFGHKFDDVLCVEKRYVGRPRLKFKKKKKERSDGFKKKES